MIATTPETPYYSVIFTSSSRLKDDAYAQAAERMLELAQASDGFLGVESVSNNENGITVSYWRDLESIRQWKMNLEHQEAQQRGREKWYQSYRVRIAKVEREYGFDSE